MAVGFKPFAVGFGCRADHIRGLRQPRRGRRQERHKFAYLTMKNCGFAGFARAFSIFVNFSRSRPFHDVK